MLAPHRPLPTGWIRACVVLVLMVVGTAPALAINGTWIDTTSGGLWSTTTNWSGGVVANGTDGIADFSTLNITADDTVHLDTARTIGQLKFGDTTPSNNWILDNNGVPTNVLTLAVSLGSPTITVNNDTATMNLVLAGTQGFAKSGAGELLLNDADTFTGSVAINAGTLALGNSGALGSTSNAVSVTAGATLDLGGQAIGANPLTISGTGVGGNGALINSSSSPASFAGTITAAGPFTVGGSGDITLSGSVNISFPNALTKIGNDTLTLSCSTDNSGLAVTVNSGTVILAKMSSSGAHAIGGGGLTVNGGIAQLGGSGGDQIYDFANVTVNSGAFDAAGQSETFNILSLAGTGIAGNGALLNSSSGASTITPTGGTVLTANATIGVTQGSSSLTLNSTISGAFGITKVGPGTLTLGGNSPNTFTGTTMVSAGTLILDKPDEVAATSRTLNIGTGIGLPGSAVVLDDAHFQLRDTNIIAPTNVTIQSDGILNLQNNNDGIGNLTMTGGTVTSGAGGWLLVFGGTSITTKASSYTATISEAQVFLPSVLFTVAQGTTANGIDLDVSAQLVDDFQVGQVGSITKLGPGAVPPVG